MVLGVLVLAMLASSEPWPVSIPPVMAGQIRDGERFRGGPYAGLSIGMATVPTGRMRALLPSSPGHSPIRERDIPAVQAFIAGHRDPASEPLARFLTKQTKIAGCYRMGGRCEIGPRLPLKFAEPVKANTPYYLGDGKIRIEWVYGEAVWHITELQMSNGKISRVQSRPAWLPLKY